MCFHNGIPKESASEIISKYGYNKSGSQNTRGNNKCNVKCVVSEK